MTRIPDVFVLALVLVASTSTAKAQSTTATNAATASSSAASAAGNAAGNATAQAKPASVVPQPSAQLAIGEVHPEAAALIDQIMSPFCPGLILTNCPTLAADSLRRAIRERFNAGASRAQVMKELSATYGEAIRSAPDRSGFGLLAWVVPGSIVLIGGLVLTAFIRRRRDAQALVHAVTPTSAPRAPDSALDAELAARLRDG